MAEPNMQQGNSAPQDLLASPVESALLTSFLIQIFVILACVLIVLWPHNMVRPNADGISLPVRAPDGHVVWVGEVSVFGIVLGTLGDDVRLFALVVVAGMLGGFIHVATSAADYIGNRRLSRSWIYWYLLRFPVGSSLAIVVYLLIRGGLLTGTASSTQLQPYGVVGIAALAGLFSKQATDKLRDVFETLFTPKGDVKRADPLSEERPSLTRIDPEELMVGTDNRFIDLHGENFQCNSQVWLDNSPREPHYEGTTKLRLELSPDDVREPHTYTVKVKTGSQESESRPLQIKALPNQNN